MGYVSNARGIYEWGKAPSVSIKEPDQSVRFAVDKVEGDLGKREELETTCII